MGRLENKSSCVVEMSRTDCNQPVKSASMVVNAPFYERLTNSYAYKYHPIDVDAPFTTRIYLRP